MGDVPGMVVTAVALPSARSTARSASAWTAQQKQHLETRVSSLPRKVAVSKSTKEMEIAMMKITTLDATGTLVIAVAIKSKKLTAKSANAWTLVTNHRVVLPITRAIKIATTRTTTKAVHMMLTISVVVTGTVVTAVAPRLRRNTAKYANAWLPITRAIKTATTRTTTRTVAGMVVIAAVQPSKKPTAKCANAWTRNPRLAAQCLPTKAMATVMTETTSRSVTMTAATAVSQKLSKLTAKSASARTRKRVAKVLASPRPMLATATVAMKITTAVANMVVTAVSQKLSKLTAKTALALTRNKRRSAMASVVPKHMWATETAMTTTTIAVATTTVAIAVQKAAKQL